MQAIALPCLHVGLSGEGCRRVALGIGLLGDQARLLREPGHGAELKEQVVGLPAIEEGAHGEAAAAGTVELGAEHAEALTARISPSGCRIRSGRQHRLLGGRLLELSLSHRSERGLGHGRIAESGRARLQAIERGLDPFHLGGRGGLARPGGVNLGPGGVIVGCRRRGRCCNDRREDNGEAGHLRQSPQAWTARELTHGVGISVGTRQPWPPT